VDIVDSVNVQKGKKEKKEGRGVNVCWPRKGRYDARKFIGCGGGGVKRLRSNNKTYEKGGGPRQKSSRGKRNKTLGCSDEEMGVEDASQTVTPGA